MTASIRSWVKVCFTVLVGNGGLDDGAVVEMVDFDMFAEVLKDFRATARSA